MGCPQNHRDRHRRKAGLTGWRSREGKHAIQRCFATWLDRYGLGNREDEQIISQAEGWFSAHSYSRFIDWADASGDREPSVHNVVGYRRRDSNSIVFLVHSSAFVDEIAEGYDKTAAAEALARAGMLEKGKDKATSKHRTPDHPEGRWFYKFVRTTRAEA